MKTRAELLLRVSEIEANLYSLEREVDSGGGELDRVQTLVQIYKGQLECINMQLNELSRGEIRRQWRM